MSRPIDHARPLPADVVHRCAATWAAHGTPTEPTPYAAAGAGTPAAADTNTNHQEGSAS